MVHRDIAQRRWAEDPVVGLVRRRGFGGGATPVVVVVLRSRHAGEHHRALHPGACASPHKPSRWSTATPRITLGASAQALRVPLEMRGGVARSCPSGRPPPPATRVRGTHTSSCHPQPVHSGTTSRDILDLRSNCKGATLGASRQLFIGNSVVAHYHDPVCQSPENHAGVVGCEGHGTLG
jgi:hypothetical protein